MDWQEHQDGSDGTIELEVEDEVHRVQFSAPDPLRIIDVQHDAQELERISSQNAAARQALRDEYGLEEGDEPEETLDPETLVEYRSDRNERIESLQSKHYDPLVDLADDAIDEIQGVTWGDTTKFQDWPEHARRSYLRNLNIGILYRLFQEFVAEAGLEAGEKKS